MTPLQEQQRVVLFVIDRIIRFMGLIGGFILAMAGIVLQWWDNTVGMTIYVVFFAIAIFYCSEYNGREWTSWNGR